MKNKGFVWSVVDRLTGAQFWGTLDSCNALIYRNQETVELPDGTKFDRFVLEAHKREAMHE